MTVCVKQVLSTGEVRMDPVTNTMIREGRQSVINPFDLHALEAAILLKERLGGEITALSMGIPTVEALLRDAIARGADRAVLLSDRAFAGADTLATSRTLAAGMGLIGGFDLILCGKMAVDGDTAQIGPELAEALDIPHVADVCEILTANEYSIQVRQAAGYGFCTLEVALPALITVTREANRPRMPSLAGIRRSRTAPLRLADSGELALEPCRMGLNGSPTRVVKTFVPVRERVCRPVEGSPSRQAAALLDMVKEVGI
jgi:electron transfer flavoprotein beta subunit